MKPYYETELGKLWHGDCADILKYTSRGFCVFTDPPYGIDIAKTGTVGVRVKAGLTEYRKSDWDKARPSESVFKQILEHKKVLLFGGNYFADILPPSKCWLVWDKKIPKGFTKAQIELIWTNLTTYSRLYDVLWHGMIRNRGDGDEERYHPTQKPIVLISNIITDLNLDNIIDPFLGSGTTAIACERLNRRWIGIEIEEKYCEIAAKRIENERKQLKLF